jgi:hypothetical protein
LEEVRGWVEGRRYESMEAKKAAVEEVLRRVGSQGEGLIAGRVALHPSSFECPAFMIMVLLREDFSWVEEAFGVKGGFESAHER